MLQKPIRHAYAYHSEAIRARLNEQCPVIDSLARAEGAVIYSVAETIPVKTAVCGRNQAPGGKQPVSKDFRWTRHKLSRITNISDPGQVRWTNSDGAFHSVRLIEFVDIMIQNSTEKEFLITDSLWVHQNKPIEAGGGNRLDKIELLLPKQLQPGSEFGTTSSCRPETVPEQEDARPYQGTTHHCNC